MFLVGLRWIGAGRAGLSATPSADNEISLLPPTLARVDCAAIKVRVRTDLGGASRRAARGGRTASRAVTPSRSGKKIDPPLWPHTCSLVSRWSNSDKASWWLTHPTRACTAARNTIHPPPCAGVSDNVARSHPNLRAGCCQLKRAPIRIARAALSM